MRVVELASLPGRPIDSFGSTGVTAARVAPAAHVVTMRVAAGGEVGRHPAVGDQLFVVVSGTARVSGADGVEEEIGTGQAALWFSGEQHRTRALTDVVALVIEAEVLPVGLA